MFELLFRVVQDLVLVLSGQDAIGNLILDDVPRYVDRPPRSADDALLPGA